jgi:glycine cleavage system H protein
VGITDYAQESLGEIVFVELPEIASQLNVGDVLGVVESVKAASDVYSPIAGTVIEVNEALDDDPALLNEDPYVNWIAVLEFADDSILDELMDASGYEAYCSKEE